jgi:hypothetical protein
VPNGHKDQWPPQSPEDLVETHDVEDGGLASLRGHEDQLDIVAAKHPARITQNRRELDPTNLRIAVRRAKRFIGKKGLVLPVVG